MNMYKHSLYIEFGVFLIFTWKSVELAPSLIDLQIIKNKWDECCEKHICINNSCYIALRRASSWPAVRQRCQGQFPDWTYLVDLLEIRNEEDLKVFSEMIQERAKNEFERSRKVWTSGMRCPKSIPKGPPVLVTRWASTNRPFPEWLEDKISYVDVLEESDECKFLLFSTASNISEIKYEFQDQFSHHVGICEFIFPGEVPVTTPTDESTHESTIYESTTYKSTINESTINESTIYESTIHEFTSYVINNTSTTMTETEHFSTKATTIKTKSRTVGPSENFKSKSTEKVKVTLTYPSSVPTTVTHDNTFCTGKREAGIEWPDTAAGVTANESCPEGMIGYAQWTCEKSTLQFIPANPHVQDCEHIWIKDLEENVEKGKDAINISSELADKTKKKEMSHGDITALVDLSVKILHLFANQSIAMPKTKPYNFTENMVSSMSNILRAEIKDAWEVLPKSHQTRAASKILQIVTIIGSHLSCDRKSDDKLQYTISSTNIGLQTFILDEREKTNDQIVFPQKVDGVAFNSSLIVPANLVWRRPSLMCPDKDTAVGVLYKHVGDFLKDESLSSSNLQVVTKVISFSMNNNTESLLLPKGKEVTIVLKHTLHGDYRHEDMRCMFWNFSKQTYGQWDSSGCFRVTSNDTHIVCSCNHLTNFAVLMDVNNNVKEDKVLSMMTYVCCGMSSFSLVITLICFLSIRSLHGRRSIITGNLCFCLLITNLLILFGLDQTKNQVVCASIAGFLHFCILSAFCWMLVEGYHLYKMVVLVFERGYVLSIKSYYIFAYGIPLFVVGVSAGIRWDDYVGKYYCWLNSNNGLIWSFVGPACAIILVNIIVFVLTLRSASSVRIKREQTTVKKIKNWARGSMSVMCLLGLTWCLGLFYIEKKLWVFSYIFTVLNGLQGVFIFLFHVLLNDKVNLLFRCSRKKDDWGKSFPQTSSHHLHSKLSTRTSVNSVGCISCNVPVNPIRSFNAMKSNQNSYKESENTSNQKVRSRRNWNLEKYRKEKATRTISDNGLQNLPPTRRFKPRSQSFPEDQENGVFPQNISTSNRRMVSIGNPSC